MPADLVPASGHGDGADPLGSVAGSSAAVTDPDRTRPPEQRWQAGLLLWTAPYGLVSRRNDHGDPDWPPSADLLVDLIGPRSGRPAAEVEALLTRSGACPGHTRSPPVRSRPVRVLTHRHFAQFTAG